MIDVNLKGVLYGIAAALPVMKERKSGHTSHQSMVTKLLLGPRSIARRSSQFGLCRKDCVKR